VDIASLQGILDCASDAHVAIDEGGRIVFWNVQAAALFGLSRADALGRDAVETIVPVRLRAVCQRSVDRFVANGSQARSAGACEAAGLRPDGSEFAVVLSTSVVRGERGRTLHAVIRETSSAPDGTANAARTVARLADARHGIDPRFTSVLDSLAEAITIRDLNDRITYANRAALASLGYESVAELREARPRAIMDDYVVKGEDGRRLTMADIPSVRLLRGEDPPPLLMNTIHRASGEEHWRLLKSTALRDGAGNVEAAVTIIEDLTSVKLGELRARLLAAASEALAASLDYEQTLRNVASLAVPGFADWCAVDLAGSRGERQSVVVAHSDPQKLALAERLRALEPAQIDPNQGLGRVLRTGSAELFAEITDAMLERGARSAQHLALLREVGMNSAMIVPLRIGGRTIGAMSLVNAESHRRFDGDALTVAQQIADRAATAVENARLYRSRSRIASTLQRSLLPEALPEIDGWELSALYRAAGEGIEVGGDFYDAFAVADGWLVLIGDVTGKGVAAAAMTAMIRHSARIIAEETPEPRRVCERLDAVLRRETELSLCSLLCLWIRGSRVVLSSAGHPLALLIGGRDDVRTIGASGPLLGAYEDAEWPQETLDLRDDQTLLLYTDGVTDAVGAGGRFGFERLLALAADSGELSGDELLARLDDRLAQFQVGSQADDTAALAIRRRALTTLETRTHGTADALAS